MAGRPLRRARKSRALDNAPRQFFEKLKEEQETHGGWTVPREGNWPLEFVILGGPHAGTYVSRGGQLRYQEGFYQGDSLDPAITRRRDQVDLRTKQLYKILRSIPAHFEDFQAALFAEHLYILAQASGTPLEKVVQDLQDEPRRALSIKEIPELPRQEDRRRFGKVFFQTWSVKKALRAILPNVEGDVLNLPEVGVEKARQGLTGFPSWRQTARRYGKEEAHARGLKPHGAYDEFAGTLSLVDSITAWRKSGIGLGEARKLAAALSIYEGRLLTDTLDMLHQYKEELAETVEGRRVLQAREDKDWKAIIRAHDFVNRVRQRAGHKKTAIQEKQAAAFHAGARKFVLPPGVIPLTTREEFEREGEEMSHCVGMYFWQRKSYCFSFRAPDGCRATLEWNTEQGPVQFYGQGNSEAGPGCRGLLAGFIMKNKQRSKATSSS